MGMNQIPLLPSRTMVARSVRARIYRTCQPSGEPTQVFYREDPHQPQRGRYLLAADQLSDPRMQPYVHDSIVTIFYRGKKYVFRVFYKRHKFLPINQALQNLAGVLMEGDVLVVAMGSKVGIRNIRDNLEMRVAERAVQKFAQKLAPFRNRRTFPSSITV
ncbi:hypothetical protein BT96DRAFT_1009845 [Gymnopus androsaceus JB14]|uniref:Uncharacterized protein n=1 Tax=Gymnopus androsaceus JB14 TaxID=1447944 RepID=A0A6A4GC00_9AGAR|nr:hypothetical protein BT96DRAFT_1009845 [Gymnopus androsaceus JB14]